MLRSFDCPVDESLSIRRDILEAPGSGVTLSSRLAQAVFDKPALDWSLRFAAERVALTECKFKAELFREGSALTTTVREQRLMRGLLELMGRSRTWSDLEHLAAQLGFTNLARFDAACLAQFGCSATHIARLAWYPPLTWSVSSPFSSIDTGVSISQQEMQRCQRSTCQSKEASQR